MKRSGYPMLRLLTAVACGTRTVIDAVFGPYRIGETSYAPELLRCVNQTCCCWPTVTSPPRH